MEAGGSTYSRRPFRPQFEELAALGFDYAELDVAHVPQATVALAEEAEELAALRPIRSTHLPTVRFDTASLERCVGFLDVLTPLGCTTFNVHLHSPYVRPSELGRKRRWLARLVAEAARRGAVVTVENLDEGVDGLRPVLDAVDGLRFCLDVGHAFLGRREGRSRDFLRAFGHRLGLVHLHDNRGGEGKAGDLHLPLGAGDIDVPDAVQAVRRTGYDGLVTLEVFRGEAEHRRASLETLRRLWAGE